MKTRVMIVVLLIAGGSALAAEPEPLVGPAADERAMAFLAEHGLDDVTAAMHRRKLADGTPEEKKEAAEALGKIYGKQLGETNDPAARKVLEAQCKDLLLLMPDVDGFELRISLAKTTYLKAEEIAERDRLRLAGEEEKAEGVRILEQVGPAFKDIASRVHRKHESVDKRVDQVPDEKAEALREEVAELRRLRSLARYYAGWSDLYLATLTGRTASAQSALEQFGWLLNAPEGKPAMIDRIPVSLLRYEHVARAAMGTAMALAAKGNAGEGVRWLDAVLYAEGVPPAVLDQLFVRRIGVLASGGQWVQIEALLRERKAKSENPDQSLPPAAARLAVVLAMEYLKGKPAQEIAASSARNVAAAGTAELVARGDLAQVVDLAKRYGVEILGERGFVPAYVRAVQSYEEVRAAHKAKGNPDAPTDDADVKRTYLLAAEGFAKASAEPDASSFGEAARLRSVLLDGLCRYYAGEFAAAGDRFESAGTDSAPEDLRRDALWFAVLAFERAVEKGRNDLAERRDKASIVYITAYPATENAARLLVRRSGGGVVTEERAVEILLAVPESSSVRGLARRQAAKILYQIYRRSDGRTRDEAALRFAGVAEDVLAKEAERSLADVSAAESKEASAVVVLYARQVADALLGATVPDATRAENALTLLEKVSLLHSIDTKPFEAEIGYRRLQIALARGDEGQVKAWTEKLGGETGEYPKAATRLMYRRSLERWKASARPADAMAVVEHGRKVIAQIERDGGKLPDDALSGVYDGTAGAASSLAAAGDAGMRTVAIGLDAALIAAGVRTESVLRRVATLREAGGENETARVAWGELAAAVTPGSVVWAEARYNAVRLQALVDVAGAKEVLKQHAALYPSWGPVPWGEKLADLAKSLGVEPAKPKGTTGGGGGAS